MSRVGLCFPPYQGFLKLNSPEWVDKFIPVINTLSLWVPVRSLQWTWDRCTYNATRVGETVAGRSERPMHPAPLILVIVNFSFNGGDRQKNNGPQENTGVSGEACFGKLRGSERRLRARIQCPWQHPWPGAAPFFSNSSLPGHFPVSCPDLGRTVDCLFVYVCLFI